LCETHGACRSGTGTAFRSVAVVVYVAHQDQPPVLRARNFAVALSDAATPVLLDLSAFVHDVDNTTAQLQLSVLGAPRSAVAPLNATAMRITAGVITSPLWARTRTVTPFETVSVRVPLCVSRVRRGTYVIWFRGFVCWPGPHSLRTLTDIEIDSY
jgi:hypothetical protein